MNLQQHKKQDLESLRAFALTHEPKIPETNHFWASGAYVRQMKMDAGDLVIGKPHKMACVNVIAAGKLRVLNVADENDVVEHSAGAVFVSPPGTERAIFALEDTYWITCHATEETDLEKIEELFVGGGS